jgi:hypothetical protein
MVPADGRVDGPSEAPPAPEAPADDEAAAAGKAPPAGKTPPAGKAPRASLGGCCFGPLVRGADGTHPRVKPPLGRRGWRVGDSALASRLVESREHIVCSTVRASVRVRLAQRQSTHTAAPQDALLEQHTCR